MKRGLFIFAYILSVILGVSTAAMCIRSYYYSDDRGRCFADWSILYIRSLKGSVIVAYETRSKVPEMRKPIWGGVSTDLDEPNIDMDVGIEQWSFLGLRHGARAGSGSIGNFPCTYRADYFCVRYGVLGVIASVIPVWHLLLQRRRRRTARLAGRFCLICGYDLRASSERCPECGTAITHAAPQAEVNTSGMQGK